MAQLSIVFSSCHCRLIKSCVIVTICLECENDAEGFSLASEDRLLRLRLVEPVRLSPEGDTVLLVTMGGGQGRLPVGAMGSVGPADYMLPGNRLLGY